MSSPALPPSLEHLSARPFSFYPPIVNIEHNEWLYVRASWSEILVRNAKTGMELWISRRYVGAVSKVDDPVLIVGLVKELEYKAGTVWPTQRKIIEMPAASSIRTAPSPGEEKPAAAAMGGAPSDSDTDTRLFKLIGGAVVLAIVLCLLALNFVRVGEVRQRIRFTTRDQSYLELSGRDDYFKVVQKLGRPTQENWQSETGAIQYQALQYPDRGYTVILMGSDRKSAVYIGTLDTNWTPVHSVELRSGGTTFAMLRGLKKF
jgi:hypothetical protein